MLLPQCPSRSFDLVDKTFSLLLISAEMPDLLVLVELTKTQGTLVKLARHYERAIPHL